MSVLRINQNPIALDASRNLKNTSMAINTAMERLSSGLRINRAADDAAGLSISEKLRGQIRGLNQASSNAQDGISLIQTADGALNEVTTILQRMRELAVQAANGTYTADDRQAIQQEVSQLVDEINRISGATEFNSKKLLDGTLGALISTDDYTKVRAAVVGQVGKGGNFVVKAIAKSTGRLQVQKTDVFATTQATDSVGHFNYLSTWGAGATILTASTTGIGNTGISQIEVPVSAAGSLAATATSDAQFRLNGTGTNFSLAQAGDSAVDVFQSQEVTLGTDKILITTQDAVNGVLVTSLTMNAADTASFTAFAAAVSTALGNAGGANLLTGVAFNNATGQLGIQLNAGNNAQILNVQFQDVDGSGSNYYLSFGAGAAAGSFASNTFVNGIAYSFFNRNVSDSAVITASNASVYTIGGAATTGQVNVRFDPRFDWVAKLQGLSAGDTLRWGHASGNSFQKYGVLKQTGPATANGTFLVSALSDRSYAVYQFNNALYTSLVAQGTDQGVAALTARGVRLTVSTGASNGVFSLNRMFIGSVGSSLENVRIAIDGILQTGETATFDVSTNNVLTADQQNTLGSINRFQDFGVFNGRNSTELTIYLRGQAKSATVQVNKNDTLEDLASKISLAIWDPASGNGVVNSAILDPLEAPDLVHVNTIGVAKGTMSITTPVPGTEMVFAGDESLLKALSLFEVQKGQAATYSVSAYNLDTNQSAGTVITDSNEINGLLPGLRIFFDNTLGLRLDPNPPNTPVTNGLTSFAYLQPTERPAISLSNTVESFFIHVAPRDFSLQIGANQGETLSNSLSEVSAKSLGVEGILVVDSNLAQEAISVVDQAIQRVSNQRSRLGAIQNRLESTIRNLDVASENLTNSESRIRDVDIASETTVSTRNQILLQAGVAALAQANQLPQSVLQLLR
jgi:flagellin